MLKTTVYHFDCVINRSCEGREPSVPVKLLEEKRAQWRRIGGSWEAFSALKTLDCVRRSLGCRHRDISTEDGDDTCILLRQRVWAVPQEVAISVVVCPLKEKFGLFVDFEFDGNGLLGQGLIYSRWFDKNSPTESS